MHFARTMLLIGVLAHQASAAPLEVRHGRPIRVALAGKTESAIALRALPAGGWKLEVAATTATLSFRDVTGGNGASPRFQLSVVGGRVVLDGMRFRADHAYRVELYRGENVVGSVLIYLQPPRGRSKVVFDERDSLGRDDELAPSDKGVL
jgi:hypothetical protein